MAALPESRRQLLRDSADLNRLLAAAIRAHMLEEHDRLENLLSQVTPNAVDLIADLVVVEADRPTTSYPTRDDFDRRPDDVVTHLMDSLR